jgi:hypothetical protein
VAGRWTAARAAAQGRRWSRQLAGLDDFRGKDAEGDEVHADVGRDCQSLEENDDHQDDVAVGTQGCEQRRDDHAKSEDTQEQRSSPEALKIAGPFGPWQVPYLRHREQACLGEA